MFLIVDKKAKAILHMSNSIPGEDKKPEEVLPQFDPVAMEFGRAAEQYVPVRFTIENGVVKDLEPPLSTPQETLAQARARVLREITNTSLANRARLIPDYQIMNAGLGLYDQQRTQAIRTRCKPFVPKCSAWKRLSLRSGRSRSLPPSSQPSFPTEVLSPPRPVSNQK